jgi:hypothetical protein
MWKRKDRRAPEPQPPSYRLDELGWLQFERLCAEVLELESGLDAGRWRGRADQTRTAIAPERLREPLTGDLLPGPVLVVAAWTRPRRTARSAQRELLGSSLVRIVQDEGRLGTLPRSLLLLTNLDPNGSSPPIEGLTTRALGPRALSALADRSAEIRRRVPSLLGVRDVDELIPAEVARRSSADHDAARALARVFVPTRAYGDTLAVLRRHRFAVLTGPPEMGKTAIARTIALTQMTCGWEAHECIRPDELWRAFDRDRAQVFIADDAFGSTEYRPDAAERWALELDRVLRVMDDRHWLIWTSRPAPLKAGLRRIHREHGTERWPQPAEVQIAASDLDVEEKASILFRHARAARLPPSAVALVQAHGWEVVEHRHFTPERIRRFVSDRLLHLARGEFEPFGKAIAEAVDAEIREPTAAMAASLHALGPAHRALLIALLDTPPAPVPERELAAAVRRHSQTGFPRPPGELVDRLTDHFVRVIPPMSVAWVHPSWRDLVIESLRDDAGSRHRFLTRCSVEGILLALSVAGGVAGERAFPLLIDDADWDTATARLAELSPELADTDLFRVLGALREGTRVREGERTRAEFDALATAVLERVRRRWDATHAPIPVSLLEAWLATAASVSVPPPTPDLAATWIELLPTDAIDLESLSELNRLDEWVSLVAALAEHAEEALAGFGFPQRQLAALDELIRRSDAPLERRAVVDGQRDLLARVLQRLARLPHLPYALATRARARADMFAAREEPGVELRTSGRAAGDAPPAERSIVARVLRDLQPEP